MGNVSACHSWNGFGGKVDPGETSLEAAVRELEVTSRSVWSSVPL